MVYYNDDIIQIRDLQEDDVVSLFSWWIDKEINKYDPKPIPENSKQLIEECTRYCNTFDIDKMNNDVKARKYRYFIITDAENNPIGSVNFFGIDNVKKQGELGVCIGDKGYWGKGIATKAVKIALDNIFTTMDINRVYIETGEANKPAIGLFKKLGFVPCGEYVEDDGFKFIVMEMKKLTEESLHAWEINADFWDAKMGDESNSFHQNIVRPNTEKLLNIKDGDYVLDIACGNGNFSQRLAENGAKVVAFDYSSKLIEHAKRRRANVLDNVEFHICDATKYEQLKGLKGEVPFNKAVANMAVMDIADIEPLFQVVYNMLCDDGIFVFSTHHPCFTYPDEKYISPSIHKGEAIKGQPVLQNYYHRSIQDIFNIAFKSGFMINGFFEEVADDKEKPIIIIVRLIKKI